MSTIKTSKRDVDDDENFKGMLRILMHCTFKLFSFPQHPTNQPNSILLALLLRFVFSFCVKLLSRSKHTRTLNIYLKYDNWKYLQHCCISQKSLSISLLFRRKKKDIKFNLKIIFTHIYVLMNEEGEKRRRRKNYMDHHLMKKDNIYSHFHSYHILSHHPLPSKISPLNILLISHAHKHPNSHVVVSILPLST